MIGIGRCPITCPRTVWWWYGPETKAEGAAAMEVAAIEAMVESEDPPDEAGDLDRQRGDVGEWPCGCVGITTDKDCLGEIVRPLGVK